MTIATHNIPNILDQTTCLLVRFRKTGLIRRGDKSLITTQADKDKLRLNKQIMESDSYDTMLLIARDLRRYIKKRELPSPFAQGTHLITVGLVQEINEKINNAKAGIAKWADLFVAEYPAKQEAARESLKDQFNPKNYHSDMSKLRDRFYVESRWFDFSPASSTKVGPSIAEAEKANEENETADLYHKIRAAMRLALKQLIDHLVDRLTPGADGKRKQFAATTVTNCTEWLEIFSKRNVCNDTELALLANKAEGILKGVTVSDLKDSENVAANVALQMNEINTLLTGLVEECDERALALDEDDDE